MIPNQINPLKNNRCGCWWSASMKPLIRAITDCFWKLLICGKCISQHFIDLSTNESIRCRLNDYLKVFEDLKWSLAWSCFRYCWNVTPRMDFRSRDCSLFKNAVIRYCSEYFCNSMFYFIIVSRVLYSD